MVISPNSDIILYSGMPLDDTYTDTLYFDNLSAQTSFFQNNSYIKRTFAVNTYQRINEGVFDANCLADEIYDCNYMAFRNTNFGNKWFYAFINRIEYVNNGMARVNFSLDVIQTYLFDAVLEDCFVEREHSQTDEIGEHIETEPIGVNEYVYDFYNPLTFPNDIYACDICVMYCDIPETTGATVEGNIYGNIYSGARIKCFGPISQDPGDMAIMMTSIDGLLEDYIKSPDSIVSIYISPHFITQGERQGKDLRGYWSSAAPWVHATWNMPSGSDTFVDYGHNTQTAQSYKPKNNKLYTYPYSYCHVDNANGSTLQLRFELFEDNTPQFCAFGSPISPIQLSIVPHEYKNQRDAIRGIMTEKLTLDEYPVCSWNYDTFRAWVAQNTVPQLINLAGSGMMGAMGGGVKGAMVGMAGSSISMATSTYTASIKADTLRGNALSGNANFASNFANFNISRARPPINEVKIIDDFFTMFGYAVKRVKTPNRNARPHWTYCKTGGAKVIGKCPSEALKKICEVYDNGLTWWKNASDVGNYTLDNSPS